MMEKKIIGNILMNRDRRISSLEYLKNEYFSDINCRNIYKAVEVIHHEEGLKDYGVDVMIDLAKKHDIKIDMLFVMESINEPIFYSGEWHVVLSKLISLYKKKELSNLGLSIANDLSQEKIGTKEAIDKLKDTIEDLDIEVVEETLSNGYDLVSDAIQRINERASQEGLSGVDTGFKALNELFDGYQKTELHIMAGRPAMGKTAMALQSFLNVVRQGGKAIFFSLEMSKEQLMQRVIANETDTYLNKIKKGQLNQYDWERINSKIGWLLDAKDRLFIDDRAGITLSQMRQSIRKMNKDNDLDVIFIDYLQLIEPDEKYRGNKVQEITQISRGLKIIAKEENVTVIALAQLSRSVETRDSKIPQLADLRDSGSIEQDADTIGFCYRPEYYGIKEDEEGNSTEGVFMYLFKKHRSGDLANLKMACDLSKQKIWEEKEEIETFNTPFKPESQHDFPMNENPIF